MANEIVILDVLGALPIVLQCTSAVEGEPELIGEEGRAYANNLRVSSTGEKRTWNVVTVRQPTAIKTAIRRIIARRNQIYCMGELLADNPVIDPLNVGSANWTKVTFTPTSGIRDPFNGLNAQTMTATGASANANQHLPNGFVLVREAGLWIRRRTGSGVIQILAPKGDAWVTVVPTANWQPFSTPSVAAPDRWVGVLIGTSGDAIDVYAPTITSEPVLCSVRMTQGVMAAGVYDHELALTLVEV